MRRFLTCGKGAFYSLTDFLEIGPDDTCRPGGLELTRRALELSGLPDGAALLDIGCGNGVTVSYLNQTGRFAARGLDGSPGAACANLEQGDAAALPFGDSAFDGVLLECSLSKMTDVAAALREARRVLRPGGKLLVSDLYAMGEATTFDGLLGGVEPWPVWEERLTQTGFTLLHFEDHTPLLASLYAKLLFTQGPEAMEALLGGDRKKRKRSRCGYFLAALEKPVERPPLDAWIGRLTQTERLSALRAWQERAALASILRAKKTSAFYAAHLSDFSPEAAKEPGWLERLPFTDAEDLTRYGQEMLCVPAREVSRIRSFPTSGSSGPAKRVWFTDNDLERTIDFFSVGMRPLVSPGGLVTVFMSDGREGSIARLLEEGLARYGAKTKFCGAVRDAKTAAATAEGAECLVGLPAEMLYLCRKAPTLRPKTVLLSADYIPLGLDTALEKEWGCRVFCHYGLTESGYGLAVQCSQRQGQHLRAGDYLVEIIDPVSGISLPPGQTGEVVLTSLRSEALPLVRYRTGDIASLLSQPCACGSALPRLGAVWGRYENLRRAVNIHRLDDLLLARTGICGYEAAWENKALRLRVEGGPVPADLLPESVRVEYGETPPTGPGKRAIRTATEQSERRKEPE